MVQDFQDGHDLHVNPANHVNPVSKCIGTGFQDEHDLHENPANHVIVSLDALVQDFRMDTIYMKILLIM